MTLFFKRLAKDERGNILILAAISMVVLMGIAGLAIDGSLVFMTKSQMQKAADAAVLSGAQELTNTQQKVSDTVQYILNAHKETASIDKLDINMGSKVTIDLSKQVPLSFARLFGFNQMEVKVHAAAGLSPMGSAIGVAPLGIDESIALEYYTPYQLKVSSGDSSSGNFGVLALGGPGAATYEDNLRNGYQSEIKLGDIINTQTGNIAGSTRSAIQDRVNGCSQPPGDYSMRNCSRIILVPVYKPYDYTSNQMKSVQVTGFAYFYITDPMSSKDTSITGVFIKRAGGGSYVDGSKDDGAYSIRLTE